jgi:hypothetical protein
MKRIALALLLAVFMLVPAMSAGAESHNCVDLSGRAKLDFGSPEQEGKAKLEIDGVKTKVDFVETGSNPTGPNTADIFFTWDFPQGTVTLVEHSTTTPLGGPLVAFDSEIDLLTGASGTWDWSGIANLAAGKADIRTIEGTICFDEVGEA